MWVGSAHNGPHALRYVDLHQTLVLYLSDIQYEEACNQEWTPQKTRVTMRLVIVLKTKTSF